VAKANGLDLEVVDATETKQSPEYLKINPLAKIPSFEGADGYVLTECIAIAIYGTPSSPFESPHEQPLCLEDETHYQLQLSLSEDFR
jgi:hypothetical protein